MGKESPSAPPPQNLAAQTAQILQQGPALLKSQQKLAPGYTNLNLSNLNQTLNGSPTQAGYLQQYSQNILPQLTSANNTSNSQARAGTVADLGQYGAGAVSAIRGMDPGSANIYDLLQKQAGEGLAAGNQMTPDQARSLNNSLRSSQGARGLSYGPSASYQEAMANSQYGDSLLASRQSNAAGVASLGSSLYSMPGMNAVMGTTGASSQAQNFLGMGNTNNAAGNTFGTLGGYAQNLNDTNFNAQASANINGANANNAGIGNAAGLIGGLGVGAMMAFA